MKKTFLATVLALTMIIGFSACGGGKTSKSNATEQKKGMKTIYTCEMHPEVGSDKPGKCPKCGMELVKKEVPETDSTMMKHDTAGSIKM